MAEPLTRLHITPLTEELLPTIIGRTLIPLAQNISYHTIQTAPENNYGYVELPKMEADKIKMKLNGAVLKGKKIKIEEAKPRKRRHAETEDDDTAVDSSSSRKSRRQEHSVTRAHEISPDRKVKRGWTETKSDQIKNKKQKKEKSRDKPPKSQIPSKYSEKSELLFRTKVPPNKVPLDDKATKKKGKKKRRPEDAEVVHEFEKSTTVPSFLRSNVSTSTKPVEYEDGRGWVDDNGQVVENESEKVAKRRKTAKLGLEIDILKAQALDSETPRTKDRVAAQENEPSDLSTSSESSDSNPSIDGNNLEQGAISATAYTDDTSSSGSSSSESSDESDEESDGGSSSSSLSTSARIRENLDKDSETPEVSEEPSQPEVHPLEALFKRPKPGALGPLNVTADTQSPDKSSLLTPKPPRLELTTSFSFFQNSDPDIESDIEEDKQDGKATKTSQHQDESKSHSRSPTASAKRTDLDNLTLNLPPMPMTPFSTQDFHRRRLRSAAPTPDTGDIRKSTGYGSLILGEDDPDDVLSDLEDHHPHHHHNNNPTTPTATASQRRSQLSTLHADANPAEATNKADDQQQSEFEKKFWEKRGENNRAWKARRRAALKDKRQRENRRNRPVGF